VSLPTGFASDRSGKEKAEGEETKTKTAGI